MPFDYEGALAEGYTSDEIISHLETSGEVEFDFAGAKAEGYSTDDILNHLKTSVPTKPQATGTEIEQTFPQGVPDTPMQTEPVVDITPSAQTYELPSGTESFDTKTTMESGTVPSYSPEGDVTMSHQMRTPEYISSMQEEREQRQEVAQEAATEESFASSYVDPETGEQVPVEAGGIEADYPLIFAGGAKLGMFSIKGSMSSELGRINDIVNAVESDFIRIHPGLSKVSSELSNEAKYILARHPNRTEADVAEILQGVEKKDQAYALARALGETKYITQAARAEGDVAAGMVRAELETAQAKILDTVGSIDIPQAKAQYADMIEEIASDYHNVHDASPLLDDLDFLETFYGVTPSVGNRTVTQMKAVLRQNPNINLSDALEFRADLNYLLSKAKRGREKVKLKSIKDNLDGFIDSVATPEQKALIDGATSNYARTMQNNDVLELVRKNTDDRGIAVNWTKLHRDLADANLRSPEAIDALRITEAFSKRFGNDKHLLSTALPEGSNPDSGGVFGVMGYIANQLKDFFAFYGNRAENLRIQKAIIKSLKRGTTNLDFVNAMKTNKDIPDEVVKVFEDVVHGPKKPPEGPSGGGEPVPTKEATAAEKPLEEVVPPIEEAVPIKSSKAVERVDVPPPTAPVASREELSNMTVEDLDDYMERMTSGGNAEQSDLAREEFGRRAAWQIREERVADRLAELEKYNDKGEIDPMELGELDALTERYAKMNRGNTNASTAKLAKFSEGMPSGNMASAQTPEVFYPGSDLTPNQEAINKLAIDLEPEIFAELRKVQEGRRLHGMRDLRPNEFEQFIAESRSRMEYTARQAQTSTSSPQTVREAKTEYETLVRQIRRIERTPVARRTQEQLDQLTKLRAARSKARNTARNMQNSEGPNIILNHFQTTGHSIEQVSQNRLRLNYEGGNVPMTINANGTVSINTQGFRQGSGVGTRFYKDFYTALDAAGLKHNINALTNVNQMRLPINIYKFKLETGRLPIKGGQQTLQRLMTRAINNLNNIAGRDIKDMSIGQLRELARRTGPMANIHAGEASLKLYRQAARKLAQGRSLSVIALAPFINEAYKELETTEQAELQ